MTLLFVFFLSQCDVELEDLNQDTVDQYDLVAMKQHAFSIELHILRSKGNMKLD